MIESIGIIFLNIKNSANLCDYYCLLLYCLRISFRNSFLILDYFKCKSSKLHFTAAHRLTLSIDRSRFKELRNERLIWSVSHDRSQWDFQDNPLSWSEDSSTHRELTKDLRLERDNNIFIALCLTRASFQIDAKNVASNIPEEKIESNSFSNLIDKSKFGRISFFHDKLTLFATQFHNFLHKRYDN